jgi:acetyl-CoA synthetase
VQANYELYGNMTKPQTEGRIMSAERICDSQYNIGYICTTQQCEDGRSLQTAFSLISPSMEVTDFTFRDLDIESNRFANVLQGLGFSKGDVVFTFLPKVPEQFFTILGILKFRAIAGTLFSTFGEAALLDRLGDARAKCLITKKSFLKKVSAIRPKLSDLKHIMCVDLDEHQPDGVLSFRKLMEEASPLYSVLPTPPDVPSFLHYTSGSTGKPKGVLHVHGAIAHIRKTSTQVLNLNPAEVYWCTADQGWVTGTSYGIVGPWSIGVSQVHFAGKYSPETWMKILSERRVTVFYTSPTALRMLMREPDSFYAKFDFSQLKHIFSVGEPLNPEVIQWSRRVFSRDTYDTWFQTETGGIMISSKPGMEVKPGSMGKPVDGVEAAILSEDGRPVADGRRGFLCLKPGWDSMFATYLFNEAAYRARFKHGFYFTGDTAFRDSSGYYWFAGRSDDVINSAGHLISPFEVESVLLEIPQIAESAAIAAPDETLYEKVVVFVVLRKDAQWSRELDLEIRIHVSNRVSTIAAPKEIAVVTSLPKNNAGKILRRVLKAQYLGQPPGDLSTFEME